MAKRRTNKKHNSRATERGKIFNRHNSRCCRVWNFNFCLRFFVFFILASALVYLIVAVASKIKQYEYIGADIDYQETITVEGAGEVYIKPDTAVVVFSVTNEAETVAEAVAANSRRMNEVISSVKSQGVAANDLKTIGFNLYPRYEYYEEEGFIRPEGKRALVGYEVIQRLQVKIRDMEKIGVVIQQAADAGANQVGSLSFIIDDEEQYKEEARSLAIEEAENKAEKLATELGIKLRGIKSFSEALSGISGAIYRADALALESSVSPAPSIETGENKIEVRVNIVYKIQN